MIKTERTLEDLTGQVGWLSGAHSKLAKDTSTCQSVRECVRQHVRVRVCVCERDRACVAFLHVKCQKLWSIA